MLCHATDGGRTQPTTHNQNLRSTNTGRHQKPQTHPTRARSAPTSLRAADTGARLNAATSS